ncbi:hypothetical protein OS188_01480 [Xanthomarina sp. F1114]|uniref:hypothetical protein n=1 Tax=Xanthomarina sp. F1114 TaxID=2996019 RepID=UPI00225E3BAB|nr:hypothetical protein [Xanthomarina sp. F1114]MCX7546617.1 hypothetical protein [Xanthomarina sp. F1114]
MTYHELETRIKNAPQLDFGNLINDVIELFKHIWLKGFIAVLMIVVFVFGIIMVFGLIGLTPQNLTFQEDFDLANFYDTYFLSAIYGIPQTILINTVTLAILAAFYRMCRQFMLEENIDENYFFFFNKAYFSKVFMLGIIYTAIAVVAQLMFFVPYLYVFIPLSFFAVILANNPELEELAIIKLSFQLGNKKWLLTFITMFVAGVIGMLGLIACGIGVVLTISIVYLPPLFIYKEVVGFHKNDRNTTVEIHTESNLE